MPKSISFIGAGKMAAALISSVYKNKLAKSIIATDKHEENLRKIKAKFSIKTTKDNKEAVKNSDIVFICVKPQDIDNVLHEIKNEIKSQLVVSIAAGIKISHIEGILGRKRIIRVMPNINCLAGEMAGGFSAGKYATKEDIKFIEEMLNASGLVFFVKESQIDALSTISGCGPAFLSYFMKHMSNAASKKGLPKEIAYKLASKTMLGTGKLLLEKNISFDELIGMVASKKGVTLAGLKVLEKNKTNKILEKMIYAAYKRSKELGK